MQQESEGLIFCGGKRKAESACLDEHHPLWVFQKINNVCVRFTFHVSLLTNDLTQRAENSMKTFLKLVLTLRVPWEAQCESEPRVGLSHSEKPISCSLTLWK